MSPSLAQEQSAVSIVERARAGDQRAFESLCECYSVMVHAVLLSRARAADSLDIDALYQADPTALEDLRLRLDRHW